MTIFFGRCPTRDAAKADVPLRPALDPQQRRFAGR
jgi:hypothetical protein